MTVYLLRHGATAFNAERRYQGMIDSPLSPEGEADICAADFVRIPSMSPRCAERRARRRGCFLMRSRSSCRS